MHSLTCKIAAFLFPSFFMHELMIIFNSTSFFSKGKFENEKKCKMKLSLKKKSMRFFFLPGLFPGKMQFCFVLTWACKTSYFFLGLSPIFGGIISEAALPLLNASAFSEVISFSKLPNFYLIWMKIVWGHV